MTRTDLTEAAAMLRRVLTATERAELDATSAHGRALVRQMEGAAAAFEAAARSR